MTNQAQIFRFAVDFYRVFVEKQLNKKSFDLEEFFDI